MSRWTVGIAAAAIAIGWAATRPEDIPFDRQMIDPGASESLAITDVNGDGRVDLVSGEFWYQAPSWTKHHIREINFNGQYIDDFTDLPIDVDADGFVDVVQFAPRTRPERYTILEHLEIGAGLPVSKLRKLVKDYTDAVLS